MIKSIIASALSLLMFVTSNTCLRAQEIENSVSETTLNDEDSFKKETDRLNTQMKALSNEITEREVLVNHFFEIQLSDADHRICVAEEELENASWYQRLSAQKKLEKAQENKSNILSLKKENEETIKVLKQRYKDLASSFDRLYLAAK